MADVKFSAFTSQGTFDAANQAVGLSGSTNSRWTGTVMRAFFTPGSAGEIPYYTGVNTLGSSAQFTFDPVTLTFGDAFDSSAIQFFDTGKVNIFSNGASLTVGDGTTSPNNSIICEGASTVPDANGTRDLGTITAELGVDRRWRNLYLKDATWDSATKTLTLGAFAFVDAGSVLQLGSEDILFEPTFYELQLGEQAGDKGRFVTWCNGPGPLGDSKVALLGEGGDIWGGFTGPGLGVIVGTDPAPQFRMGLASNYLDFYPSALAPRTVDTIGVSVGNFPNFYSFTPQTFFPDGAGDNTVDLGADNDATYGTVHWRIGYINAIQGAEIATPTAPADGQGVLYFKDAGGGKTGLYVLFPSGAEQQIKVEA